MLKITLALLLLMPRFIAIEPRLRNELIVWNVGQGSWSTRITNTECQHFDSGGETAPWQALARACAGHANRLFFSHWDWDHISFGGSIAERIESSGAVCIDRAPLGTASKWKQRRLKTLRACPDHDFVHEIPTSSTQSRLRTPTAREPAPFLATANELSRVFWTDQILLPGDSTNKAERRWVRRLSAAERLTRILILGHHGSRTSTSTELLSGLLSLRQAVASARRARYGHPHKDVRQRLQARGVALLTTEEWGSIHFEIGESSPISYKPAPVRSRTVGIRDSNSARRVRR